MPSDGPRLYLITPAVADASATAPVLAAALAAGDVACVLLRLDARDDDVAKRLARALGEIAAARGAALLIEDPKLAARAGADGVHIRGSGAALTAALASLKPERIVGSGGLKSRDDAMTAGEAGVDYVMFGDPTPDGYVAPLAATVARTAWWAEIFNIPCVAYAERLADIGELVEAGADFVALGACVWNDRRGVAAAMRDAQAAASVAAKAAG